MGIHDHDPEVIEHPQAIHASTIEKQTQPNKPLPKREVDLMTTTAKKVGEEKPVLQ